MLQQAPFKHRQSPKQGCRMGWDQRRGRRRRLGTKVCGGVMLSEQSGVDFCWGCRGSVLGAWTRLDWEGGQSSASGCLLWLMSVRMHLCPGQEDSGRLGGQRLEGCQGIRAGVRCLRVITCTRQPQYFVWGRPRRDSCLCLRNPTTWTL